MKDTPPANALSVREMQQPDIRSIIWYWLSSSSDFLTSMGVDLTKMPTRDEWEKMLTEQINTPIEEKKSYCIIWQDNGRAIGHSNINKIVFGEEAYMHLHIWEAADRKKGYGVPFIKLTIPWFFEKYRLKKLYCEPYALNPAPNKTMQKAGFEFVKTYHTVPGWINFEQPVNLWMMTREKWNVSRE